MPTQIDGREHTMILLEGNIGAGKSTIGKAIQRTKLLAFIPEPVGVWQKKFDENLLNLFYQGIKEPGPRNRWALTFQMTTFITRAKTWTEVLAMTNHSKVLLERSIYCDRYVFAKNCYLEGQMSKTEWQIYCEIWDWLQSNWCVEPDKIIYLRTPAKTCERRIKERDRSEESAVPVKYLEKLETLHDKWLLENDKAIIIDGEQPEQIIIDNIFKQLEKSGISTTR